MRQLRCIFIMLGMVLVLGSLPAIPAEDDHNWNDRELAGGKIQVFSQGLSAIGQAE